MKPSNDHPGRLQINVALIRRGTPDGDDQDQVAVISLLDSDLEEPSMVKERAGRLIRTEEKDWIAARHVLSGFAVSGTTLFLLGGTILEKEWVTLNPVNEMHFTDTATSRSRRDWKRGRPMKLKRFQPTAVSVDGKIYVFGGLVDGDDDGPNFAEVYDTESGLWSDLECPDQINRGYPGHPCCVLDADKKILLYDCRNGRICAYDLVQGKWDEDYGKVRDKLDIDPNFHEVTDIFSSGRMLFIAAGFYWWVFDSRSMARRGTVTGIHKIVNELSLPYTVLGANQIIALGCCSSRNNNRKKHHHFLLCFWYFVEDEPSVYVARIAVFDKVTHFSANLVSFGGFRVGERVGGYSLHLFVTAETSSSEETQEEDVAPTEDKQPQLLQNGYAPDDMLQQLVGHEADDDRIDPLLEEAEEWNVVKEVENDDDRPPLLFEFEEGDKVFATANAEMVLVFHSVGRQVLLKSQDMRRS